MKKIVSVLLATLMLASLFTVVGSARGYTLSIPTTATSHNLSAYGLQTMKVFSTEQAPAVDGVIGTGEYPGPNNGCCSSNTLGNGLWMGSHAKPTATNNGLYSFSGNLDFSGLTGAQDVPEYVNIYLTYDREFLYFAVSTVMQPQFKAYLLDTRVNFIQSESFVEAAASHAWNRYNISEDPAMTTATSTNIYTADGGASTTSARVLRSFQKLSSSNTQYANVTEQLNTYVDEFGTSWNATTYKKAENFSYKTTVLRDGRWATVFEGRQPLGDILRITDVEFEDGTPIDYVPEWGAFGIDIRMFATEETTDVPLQDTIYAQTMLPCGGIGYTGAGSVISGITFTNTVSAAISSRFGAGVNYLMAPVRYLGIYDPTENYEGIYQQSQNTAANTTTRITRTKAAVLTSGVRGINGRVVAVATSSSESTGDALMITLIAGGTMVLCALAAFVVIGVKRRKKN